MFRKRSIITGTIQATTALYKTRWYWNLKIFCYLCHHGILAILANFSPVQFILQTRGQLVCLHFSFTLLSNWMQCLKIYEGIKWAFLALSLVQLAGLKIYEGIKCTYLCFNLQVLTAEICTPTYAPACGPMPVKGTRCPSWSWCWCWDTSWSRSWPWSWAPVVIRLGEREECRQVTRTVCTQGQGKELGW